MSLQHAPDHRCGAAYSVSSQRSRAAVVAQDVGRAVVTQHLEVAVVDAEPAVEHLDQLDRAPIEAEPARRLLAAMTRIAIDLHKHSIEPRWRFHTSRYQAWTGRQASEYLAALPVVLITAGQAELP